MATEQPTAEAPEAVEATLDRARAIAALQAQLAGTPRRSRPYEHATIAYRLGLAYAESPSGQPEDNLRRALACYDVAAAVFDTRSHPVEHARVLNAAGAARRLLGERQRAEECFASAAALLEGRDRDEERAAALNNLGLVRTELGQLEPAIEAFGQALEGFDPESAQGRRGRVATMVNRGLALAASDTAEGLRAAAAEYRAALDWLDSDEAPYHHGLVHHSLGVALSRLGSLVPPERAEDLSQAVAAFEESLTVFTRRAFPYQHAMAKYNLGLAHAGLAGTEHLRRALAAFEDAVAVLDPRLHAQAWQQAYASLSRVEGQLADCAPQETRAGHFAALVAACDHQERARLVQERLHRLLELPGPARRSALAELALAGARLGPEAARAILDTEINLMMELPPEGLEAVLRAQMDVNAQLGPEAREEADRVLDASVGWCLNGPQRVFVYDFLYSLGFERP